MRLITVGVVCTLAAAVIAVTLHVQSFVGKTQAPQGLSQAGLLILQQRRVVTAPVVHDGTAQTEGSTEALEAGGDARAADTAVPLQVGKRAAPNAPKPVERPPHTKAKLTHTDSLPPRKSQQAGKEGSPIVLQTVQPSSPGVQQQQQQQPASPLSSPATRQSKSSQQRRFRISLYAYGGFYKPAVFKNWLDEANSCVYASNASGCAFAASTENSPDAVVVMAGRPDRGKEMLAKLRALPVSEQPRAIGAVITEADHRFKDASRRGEWDFKVSYHKSADIPMGLSCQYFSSIATRNLDSSQTFSRKGGVAGFISNCGAAFRRNYVEKLMKHIQVDQFGSCLKNQPTPKEMQRGGNWMHSKQTALLGYQFGLALENDVQENYVTEKIFNVLAAGAIPIYHGTQDVYDQVPRGSFIDVRQYPDAADLGAYLKYLQQNRTAFNSYLKHGAAEWREIFERHGCERKWQCRVCDALMADDVNRRAKHEGRKHRRL
mmetsp:Transcript_11934/g.28111  ORF Transcript_11934/g.28111 Transcript_11934/m.28111 type:complete len:489 (+) Transcript_11934:217-1683(+)|eukprot:CAMPEP_0177690336 /NCGR_PEP_ID=MMETSP0484_2-20121128/711_1 /TAXON_ID=354590 /ORGANISM="Rhodomonas lens, Strain RHODO" /LENGTH=488 /DNA_ID=CAMNT_0019200871 /DNA_START=217 /DNA_END=1683 /DNA_ORIENTATION=-